MLWQDAAFVAFIYLIGINTVEFLTFAWDKHCAQNGMWRISEHRLLALAVIGGTIGAVIAQHWLRHKVRKEPFRSRLRRIATGQLVILVVVCSVGAGKVFWNPA